MTQFSMYDEDQQDSMFEIAKQGWQRYYVIPCPLRREEVKIEALSQEQCVITSRHGLWEIEYDYIDDDGQANLSMLFVPNYSAFMLFKVIQSPGRHSFRLIRTAGTKPFELIPNEDHKEEK